MSKSRGREDYQLLENDCGLWAVYWRDNELPIADRMPTLEQAFTAIRQHFTERCEPFPLPDTQKTLDLND